MRWCFALLTLSLNSGCAAAWLYTRIDPEGLYNDRVENVTPIDGYQRKVVVEPTYEAPAALPPSPTPAPPEPTAQAVPMSAPQPMPMPPPPPPPGHGPIVMVPVPMPPEPRPMPVPIPEPQPEPQGVARMMCTVEQRPVHEQVHREDWVYNGKWKVETAFLFVAESAMSGVGFVVAHQFAENGGKRSDINTMLVFGGLFGLDAIGTGILFFHPEEHHVKDFVRDGSWTSTSDCPDGLTVETPAGPSLVFPDGHLEPVAGNFALQQLVAPDGRLRLHENDELVELAPSEGSRCEWARSQHYPHAQDVCGTYGSVKLAAEPIKATFQTPHLVLTPSPAAP
jgi:hypothetical protein